MNSHIANLFLALQQHIVSLIDEADKSYFPHVDQDLGQLEFYTPGGRPPVTYPCVLIDVADIVYSELSENVQSGVASVVLRLGFPPFSSSSNITPEEYRKKAIYYYDLEQVLHLSLQGKSPHTFPQGDLSESLTESLEDVFGSFIRTRVVTERREDFIRVREMTYTIGFEDYSTKPSYTLVSPVAMDLTKEFTASV